MTDFTQSDGRYFDINFFEYWPDGIGCLSLPHSAIFPEAVLRLEIDGIAMEFANTVRKKHGINKSIWGVRREEGRYSVEFYFYYPKMYPDNRLSSVMDMSSSFFEKNYSLATIGDEQECYLTSVNLDASGVSDVNVYRSIFDESSDTFIFHDKGLKIDRANPRFSSYSLWNEVGPKKKNDYWGYFDGNILHRVIAKVHDIATKKFPSESPGAAYDFLMYSYPYSRSAVFDNVLVADKEGAIGLYFLRLNINDFLSFLSTHDYEFGFVNYMKENKDGFSHLLFDVGMDFYLSNGEFCIKKTAFWGSL